MNAEADIKVQLSFCTPDIKEFSKVQNSGTLVAKLSWFEKCIF